MQCGLGRSGQLFAYVTGQSHAAAQNSKFKEWNEMKWELRNEWRNEMSSKWHRNGKCLPFEKIWWSMLNGMVFCFVGSAIRCFRSYASCVFQRVFPFVPLPFLFFLNESFPCLGAVLWSFLVVFLLFRNYAFPFLSPFFSFLVFSSSLLFPLLFPILSSSILLLLYIL